MESGALAATRRASRAMAVIWLGCDSTVAATSTLVSM
jgi:hypothetical protein